MNQIETAPQPTLHRDRPVRQVRVTSFAGPEAIDVVDGVDVEPGGTRDFDDIDLPVRSAMSVGGASARW